MDRVETVVIGAGVSGAAVAFEFAAFGVDTLVLEMAAGPAAGASGAGAGIVDTGLWTLPESIESSMMSAQASRWPELFDQLNIPYKSCGAVLVASDSGQLARLAKMETIAAERGIKTRAYDRGQIRNLEPQAKAVGGLLIPGVAIADPYEMVSRLLGGGSKLRYGSRVSAVEPSTEGAIVRCDSGDIEARFVINCAGLFADEIAADGAFNVNVQRDAVIIFPQEAAILTDHVIVPLGERAGTSTVFPTIYGHLGATGATGEQTNKTDWTARPEDVSAVQRAAAKLIPRLADFAPLDAWAGLRARGHPRDFIAEWSKRVPRMYNLAAIATAGPAAALGLSASIVDRCRERGLAVRARSTRPARAGEPTIPWWRRRRH